MAREAAASEDTSWSHFAYHYLLILLGRLGEALAEGRRALELEPGNLAPAIDVGWNLAQLGRFEEARAVADVALRQQPELGPYLRTALDCERWIGERTNEPFASGSPGELVARALDAVDRGMVKEVFECLDCDLVARWAAGIGERPVVAGADLVVAVADGIEQGMAGRPSCVRLRRHRVSPEVEQRGGRTAVRVGLLVESKATDEQLSLIEQAIMDPAVALAISHVPMEWLRAMEPADRQATLVALAAETTSTALWGWAVLSGEAGRWKIVDVEREDDSLVSLSRLRWIDLRGLAGAPGSNADALEIGQQVGRNIAGWLTRGFAAARLRLEGTF